MKKIALIIALVLASLSLYAQVPVWKVERKTVKDGNVSYSYYDVPLPEDAAAKDSDSLKLLRHWAAFCRDTLFMSKGSKLTLSANAYAAYQKAAKVLEETGEMQLPSFGNMDFDVRETKWEERPGLGIILGVIGTVPMKPLSVVSGPAAGIKIGYESGIRNSSFFYGMEATAAFSKVKEKFYFIQGGNGSAIPYLGASVYAGKYLFESGKWHIGAYAGLGYQRISYKYNLTAALIAVARGFGSGDKNINAGGPKLTEGICAELWSDKSRVSFCDSKTRSYSMIKFTLYFDQYYNLQGGFFVPTVNMGIAYGIKNKGLKL